MLILDDVLATHLISKFEQKYSDKQFVRVDSDIVENLIKKEDTDSKELTWEEKQELSPVFQAVCPENNSHTFIIDFKELGEQASPMVITRSEWMRRMKDMSQMQGGMSFYGEMPDNLNLVVNTTHPLVKKVLDAKDKKLGTALQKFADNIKDKKAEIEKLEAAKKR